MIACVTIVYVFFSANLQWKCVNKQALSNKSMQCGLRTPNHSHIWNYN